MYRTIKAVNFLNYLFDLDDFKVYKFVTQRYLCKVGYYLLKPGKDDVWRVIRCLGIKEYKLSYDTRLNIMSWLWDNDRSRSKHIIESLFS